MKRKSAIGGDWLKDTQSCERCRKRERVPSYRYCRMCLEYAKSIVRAWAHEQNPIPGVDVPEC